MIVRKGTNDYGKTVRYYLNYSSAEQKVLYRYGKATEILTGAAVAHNDTMTVGPWDLLILEEH